MKLTKEKCEQALDHFEECYWYQDNSYSAMDGVRKDLEILNKLIHEHFDNPPLKFEELKQMKGIPVWNNEEKEWYLISDIYKPFVLNQYIRENATAIKMVSPNGSTKLIGLNCEEILNIEDFKEGVFYRKQVEE